MLTRLSCSLDTRRALAQWAGVIVASVVAGILLGILRRENFAIKTALEWSIPVGLTLALIFWAWASRMVQRTASQPSTSIMIGAATSFTFEGEIITSMGHLGRSYQIAVNDTLACQDQEQEQAAGQPAGV